ncbi:efflux RND transporter periplasmic adaptor subunit [Crenobacter sp. SG2305]|uniref:efflux RND transporter periplasmic adaptor subunit n=1 Tax=Crenobacter oryzisoli TaxID=3056844 RepID=UPI0025AA87B1|nr:efflux RND transporter periplasmic adaptor subunit [Crenobacter sp. SG2305]MDN0084037.1 efflux RND transporter periplasmic adaptor subunit [Crenobacter sp. SG2305]
MSIRLFSRPGLALRWGGVVAGVMALSVWSLAGWGEAKQAASTKPPPAAVVTVRVARQNVPIFLGGVGTVLAERSVTVKVRVDGQLDKVLFVEGQDVKAGQLLAQIDPQALQAQLAQALAQQARDEAQLLNARIDLQRYSQLLSQDSVSRQTYDTQKALVNQLAAAVKSDAAQVSFARVQLGYTTIRSPLSGRTGARLIDPGNIVHATDNTGLVVINQIDPIMVQFTVPEDHFGAINRAISPGLPPLPVFVYSRTDAATPLGRGVLTLVNNQIDSSTGTLTLKARFANPGHELWPGQYVNVRLRVGTRTQALTVPTAAIQRGPDGTYVYKVDADGRARLQLVRLGPVQAGMAIVEQGLAAGERVVLEGQYKLRPGSSVVEARSAGAGAVR